MNEIQQLIDLKGETYAGESLLRAQKRYNVEHEMLVSENRIVDRLLSRQTEMMPVYDEICKKLPGLACKAFLETVLSTAAFWNPAAIRVQRDARKELIALNAKIFSQASELAELLEQRTTLSNETGFSTDSTYHIIDLIDQAADSNGLYRRYIKKPLQSLRHQFDLKYWPDISLVIQALSLDAFGANITANDPVTGSAASSSRASKTDFFRALFVAIDENSEKLHGPIPDDFQLTDETLATLTNCALGFNGVDMVDAQYVKRTRQRIRESRFSAE